MITTNEYYNGVDRDTAPDGIERSRARDARNLRLITIGGKGMILSSFKGNRETFSLSSGFLPLGHAVFQGVSIIFSVNPTTGDGEIGSFPSPRVGGGFERVYRPLSNFTGTVDPRVDPDADRLPFRTACLNFQCGNQIDAEARISYDGSIEVFFTDFLNPLRHVSTGFRADTGAPTGRLYWHGNDGAGEPDCASLHSAINVFFETCNRPVLSNLSIEDGGSLRAGNWFFYPRYTRGELSATSFSSGIGPVQVSDRATPEGPVIRGDAPNFDTGKKAVLDLSDIDGGFEYIEIAFSYHHGDTFEVGLIGKLYPVPPGVSSITIEISGEEPVIDITSLVISAEKQSEDVVRSITQVQNILFGGNWKGGAAFVKDMKPIADLVVASAPDTDELYSVSNRRASDPSSENQYQDYGLTLNRVGYFRGEPYSFGVVFVLQGGKTLPPLPVTGTDHLTGSAYPTNSKGVVRFPSNQDAGYEIIQAPDLKIMGVKFDTSAATIPDEVRKKICGFYFVRAERKPQLVYQGLTSNTFYVLEEPVSILHECSAWDLPQTSQQHFIRYNVSMGEFMGESAANSSVAMIMDVPHRVTNSGEDACGVVNGPSSFIRTDDDKAAFFSSDHFFLKAFTDGGYFVREEGLVTFHRTFLSATIKPSMMLESDSMVPGTASMSVDKMVNVAWDESAPTSEGRFVSKFLEGNGDNQGGNIWFWVRSTTALTGTWEVGNREVRQRRYIGLVHSSIRSAIGQPNGLSARLVNIYKFDPASTIAADLYDPGVELYYRIGGYYKISDWGGSFIEYNGDCFLQKTYIKQTGDAGYHSTSETPTGGTSVGSGNTIADKYVWGNVLGVVSENVVNSAMRYGDSDRRFYPGYGGALGDALTIATQRNAWLEPDFLNRGYDRTLDIRGFLAYDASVPFGTGEYPTRIRYSSKYLNDTTTRDGYLIWGTDSYRDYDHSPGEIISIESLRGSLYSVQRHGLNRHYVNERYMGLGETGGEVVIGSGELLSDQAQVISGEMGSQHQWSVIKTNNAIYGVDLSLRTAWRFAANGMDPLSEIHLFHSDVYEVSEIRAGEHSDASEHTGDAPVCDEGIVGWHDRKNREVGWSFLWNTDNGRASRSIAYNEKTGSFSGSRYGVASGHSPYYILLNEDMYSLNSAAAPWSGLSGAPSFWLHDSLDQHSTFWGVLEEVTLSAVVNQSSTEPKIFDYMEFAASDPAPVSIDFATEYQRSALSPFIGNPLFWLEPRYKENRWHFTIPKTQSIVPGPNQEYRVDSPLRGKWMEVTVRWLTDLPIEARSMQTNIRQSLQ